MGLREFALSLVIAKDKRTLENWLFWLEVAGVVGSVVFLALLTFMLLEYAEWLWVVKFGFLAVIALMWLSSATILQYLLLIEWNTRKKK